MQNVALAVRALHELRKQQPGPEQPLLEQSPRSMAAGARLVLAGGYDERLAENREYFRELQTLIRELGMEDQVRLPDIMHPRGE